MERIEKDLTLSEKEKEALLKVLQNDLTATKLVDAKNNLVGSVAAGRLRKELELSLIHI